MNKSILRWRHSIVVAALALAMLFVMSTVSVFAEGLNVTQHSKQDVVNQLKNSGVSINDPVTFTTQPVKNTQRGALTNNTEQSALKMLNNVRYVAGLDPVSLNETYGGKAQAAAFVNWSIGQLTHYPSNVTSKPNDMSSTDWIDGNDGAGNSNIAYGRDTINNTIVFGWMGDSSSASNIENVGHRRWCLNPDMDRTGFGATTGQSYLDKYYAMWSADEEANGWQTNVAWPARYMPVEFFDGNIPWSLSTGNTSITSISNVSVQLTRRSTSPSGSGNWLFSTGKPYTAATTGEYFGVQKNSPLYSGKPGPFVVFRPANITYKVGDIFDVTISGLGSSSISYTVEFISGYPVETMSFAKSEYQLTSSYETITPTVTPSSAKGYEVSYSSSDESVVTVSSNGRITKAGIGEATITATIAGQYTASGNPLTASYRVKVPKSINSADVTIEFEKYVDYSTKKADIGLVIKDGNKTLVEGTDYTVSIPDDAIKPQWTEDGRLSNYIAIIRGIGNYYGSDYEAFWIWPKYLSDCQIVLSPETAEYTGGNQKPGVAVYNGDVLMTEGTDYTVTQNNGGTSRGSYTVRVSAASDSDCYANSAYATFKITEKTITESMIEAIPSTTYDGSAKTPNITVRNGSMMLVKNTDYTVTYSNNTNAGTATATITGKGNYKGSVEKHFTINPKVLNSGMMALTPVSAKYNAALQKPGVGVKDGSVSLKEGQDYTLTNSGGVNVGNYNVKVVGRGNYKGEISSTFTINPSSLSETTITFNREEFVYSGVVQKPTVTIRYGANPLKEDNDYSLSWSNQNSLNAGTYTVTINSAGNGNFTGSVNKTYRIAPKSVANEMLLLDKNEFTYNGAEQKPSVTVKDGQTHLNSADYTLSLNGGVNAGSYTIKLTGKRNYTGSADKTFDIHPKSLANADIADIQAVEYNGSAHTPATTVRDGNKVIEKGKDYTVSFGNNTNAGNATATISGTGNYTGSKVKTFTIKQKGITEKMVGPIGHVTYDGGEKKPDVVVTDSSKTLVKGTDYTVTYSNNISEGTGTATIKGTGNYVGSIDKKFEIISKERAELRDLIKELENDLEGTSDEEYKSAINKALEEAKAADGADADPDNINPIINSVRAKKEAAEKALNAKKEAAARATQKGADGTPLGKGASAVVAEAAITASASDEGLEGSQFAPLQLRSTKQAKTSIKLTWSGVSGASRYVIYGNACGKYNRMNKLTTWTGRTFTVKTLANGKALKKGTYHKFMVVALDANNNVVSTSKVVHVATKGNKKIANPTKVTTKKPKALKKGKTFKLGAKQAGKKVKKHRGLCYETSNPNVAIVSKKGVVKAVGKGTCYVYAYAQNGVFKKVKITVK